MLEFSACFILSANISCYHLYTCAHSAHVLISWLFSLIEWKILKKKKGKLLVNSIFFFSLKVFFKSFRHQSAFSFSHIVFKRFGLQTRKVCVLDYISIYLSFAYTSNLDLPKILSFGKGWKVVGKEEITCHVQFYPFPHVYQACHVKSWLYF